MFDAPDLKVTGTLLADGQPVICPACKVGYSLELRKRGPRETWPAFVTCLSCGSGEDSDVITNGLVDAALEARTGRTKAEDRDTFAAEWRGHTLVGECVPQFVLDDAITLAEELGKIGRQELREHKTAAKKQARGWWRGREKSAKRAVGQATGTVKSAALAAVWDVQTGGAGPAKKPARRCRTKGCRGGWVTITSRIHSGSGKAEQVKVACAACHRA